MRGRSGHGGAILRVDGNYYGPDVTPADERAYRLGMLLDDLSRPGLCLILGAGASYGVVPMTVEGFRNAARELREANGAVDKLPAYYQEMFANSTTRWVADLLNAQSSTSDGRALLDDYWPVLRTQFQYGDQGIPYPSNGEASVLLHGIFTPKKVPPELKQIYRTFENQNGVIVTYNVDRVVDASSGFRIIAPHGQRWAPEDPAALERAKRMAYQFDMPLPGDFHLPVPEAVATFVRPDYGEAVLAWRAARCVVFIGYAFGGGADEMSYKDFGENIGAFTKVHVLCPNPDNRDLTKQVEYGLKGRGRDNRVMGHPFRWRPLAASILDVLSELRATQVRAAVRHAADIAARHDRR